MIVKVPFLIQSWPLQGAIGGMKHLASSARRGQQSFHGTSTDFDPLELDIISTPGEGAEVIITYCRGAKHGDS